MMLPSGNDAAMILAAAAGRRIAGDETLEPEEAVQAFVAEMNRQAKGMGFEKTHFSNPDGFHTGSHYTCLKDMARIARLALGNKTIARYMRMYETEVTFLSGQKKNWVNTNLLLSPKDGFLRYDCVGMKTGYTRQAESCLMSAFRCDDGRTLVIGVFGYADSYKRFNDVNRLIKACKEQLAAEAKAAAEAEKAAMEANQE
jgi:D-alanyl-D-alanine carboxypeptidase (penicillin-binding protein 5/6)